MADASIPGLTVSGATRVACVIGDPVEHSRSPRMHNAASAALGLDRVYVAFHVGPADLGAAVRGLRALGVEGVNVTVPHKAATLALCDDLGDEARDAGAVNTLSFPGDGSLRGDLTDGLRLVAALADLVSGAEVVAAAAVPAGAGGLLVHCTPVGGIAALKQLPVPADVIERMDAVADFAYRADGSPTPLAETALAAGLPVVDGLELLVRQGALSFARWTGIEPPLDVMRRAARGE